jgi:CBS domain-containing protein
VSGKDTEISVEEIMRKEIITALDRDSIDVVSRKMDTGNVGSIVIVSNNNKPVGMVTERDIVKRVAAKNLLPAEVNASQVMSKPLMTIEPNADIAVAMRKMKRASIRRLVVIDKGKMVGVISTKDIINITPTLIDVVAEKSRIGVIPVKEPQPLTGRCNLCEEWSDDLRQMDGKFLCRDCRADIDEEKKPF